MTRYDAWNDNRTHIPTGRYSLQCVEAHTARFWLDGKGGYGKVERIVLLFQVVNEGAHMGKVVPMFLTVSPGNKVPQGSKYYKFWCVANGLRRPSRGRLSEMPMKKFLNKIFLGEVVDVRPRWNTGVAQPSLFHYSRVDLLYELEAGGSDA